MNKKNCYLQNLTLSIVIWLLLFDLFAFILLGSDIKIKQELSLSDFINVFIALIISAIIPLSIWKILEKNKSSKELLLFEINNFLNSLENLADYINSCEYTKDDKINSILEVYIPNLGNQYEIISENISNHFKNVSLDNFSNQYIDFRWIITDDLRKNDFEFNSFYKNQCLKNKLRLQKEIEKLKFNVV
ncbi:MAG: hypothetical protein ACD_49C00083G0003 [uncultured bacterium (gcode 4)]|uniref:Uncharacterized protein n=1 Tax=uncultured bacterium (gcode 4) TaxID=1234023 RepID=K2AVW7_9BACT|nr:MAG: hypothetical protein ACD_49C00083G0003 [uncultured bacterium (gcode 4)]